MQGKALVAVSCVGTTYSHVLGSPEPDCVLQLCETKSGMESLGLKHYVSILSSCSLVPRLFPPHCLHFAKVTKNRIMVKVWERG